MPGVLDSGTTIATLRDRMKTIAFVAALLTAVGVLLWSADEPREGPGAQLAAHADDARLAARVASTATPPAPEAPLVRVVVRGDQPPAAATAPDTGTGTLIVRAHWSDDGTPAVGVRFFVRSGLEDLRLPPGPSSPPHVETGPDGAMGPVERPPGAVAIQRVWPSPGGPGPMGEVVGRVEVRPGAVHVLELRLEPYVIVHGVVVDASAAPVASAVIHACYHPWDSDRRLGHVSPDGRFRIRLESTHGTVRAAAPGWVGASVTGRLDRFPASAPLELRLAERARTLRGRVVSTTGRGLGRVNVHAIQGRKHVAPSTVTSAIGEFELTGVPLDRVALLAVLHGSDFAMHFSTSVDVDMGATAPLQIVIAGPARLSGTVHDTNGALVVGATIDLRPSDDPRRREAMATSDADGRFDLREFHPGDYWLEVTAPGLVIGRWRLLTPGDETFDWSLVVSRR